MRLTLCLQLWVGARGESVAHAAEYMYEVRRLLLDQDVFRPTTRVDRKREVILCKCSHQYLGIPLSEITTNQGTREAVALIVYLSLGS